MLYVPPGALQRIARSLISLEWRQRGILTFGDLKIEEGAQLADVALARLRLVAALAVFDELDDLFSGDVKEDSCRELGRKILEDAPVRWSDVRLEPLCDKRRHGPASDAASEFGADPPDDFPGLTLRLRLVFPRRDDAQGFPDALGSLAHAKRADDMEGPAAHGDSQPVAVPRLDRLGGLFSRTHGPAFPRIPKRTSGRISRSGTLADRSLLPPLPSPPVINPQPEKMRCPPISKHSPQCAKSLT